MLRKYLPNNPITSLQPVIHDAFLKLLTKVEKKNFSPFHSKMHHYLILSPRGEQILIFHLDYQFPPNDRGESFVLESNNGEAE